MEKKVDYKAEVLKIYPDAFEHCYLGCWSIRIGKYERICNNPDVYTDAGNADQAWQLIYEFLQNHHQ